MIIEINYLRPTTIFVEVDEEFAKLKTERDPELERELEEIARDEMRREGDGDCDLGPICDEDGEILCER